MNNTEKPLLSKYRPKDLDSIVSHQNIIESLRKFIAAKSLPHLLFYGPAGTGKTSAAVAMANELYGSAYSTMVLELNASDDRGIDVVRNRIKIFCESRALTMGRQLPLTTKMIILDEVDSMTQDAQFALRRIIEKFARNVRFVLICNFSQKIIPALQSRCTKFAFKPLPVEEMRVALYRVIEGEHYSASNEACDALLKLAGGDMRRAISLLQAASMRSEESSITVEEVYRVAGAITPSEFGDLIDGSNSLESTIQYLNQLTTIYPLITIVQEVASLVLSIESQKDTIVKCFVLSNLANIERYLSEGVGAWSQIPGLAALLYSLKEIN